MELKVIEGNEHVTHVALAGKLDVEGVHEIENRFYLTTTSERKPTILDMSGVDFIGSLGVGMIVRVCQTLSTHGARLVFLNPKGLVDETLRIANINKIIPIATSREQALQLLL